MENDKHKIMLIERQYRLAVESRQNLNNNYHKWMTYYYVANGAVLIAVTSLFNDSKFGILFLSIVGLVISILWNLSCKGYYYWSKSWIHIILRLEKELIQNRTELGVFTIFSKSVAKNEDRVIIPNKPANISTPKLTLLFSFFVILCWIAFGLYIFFTQDFECNLNYKVLIVVLSLILLIILYMVLLPKWTKSRDENSHILVDCEI